MPFLFYKHLKIIDKDRKNTLYLYYTQNNTAFYNAYILLKIKHRVTKDKQVDWVFFIY